MTGSRQLARTTPFPNFLIDEVMPFLKDTEWRLLCIIVRQTLGHIDATTKRRKTSDWITQKQFLEKTGRNRAALSRAIEALVNRGIIEVRTENGRLLTSATKRRQHKGRAIYSLVSEFRRRLISTPDGSKSEYDGAVSNSLLDNGEPKSEFRDAPKANTTKEISTKENVTKEDEERIADFIELFKQTSRKCIATEPDTTLPSNAFESLRELLHKHEGMNWEPYIQLFSRSDLEYVKQRGFSLMAFVNTSNVLLLKKPVIEATKAVISFSPNSV